MDSDGQDPDARIIPFPAVWSRDLVARRGADLGYVLRVHLDSWPVGVYRFKAQWDLGPGAGMLLQDCGWAASKQAAVRLLV